MSWIRTSTVKSFEHHILDSLDDDDDEDDDDDDDGGGGGDVVTAKSIPHHITSKIITRIPENTTKGKRLVFCT